MDRKCLLINKVNGYGKIDGRTVIVRADDNTILAASVGLLENVIDPRDTRKYIIALPENNAGAQERLYQSEKFPVLAHRFLKHETPIDDFTRMG